MAERLDDAIPSARAVYSPAARRFHWCTAALVIVMWPLGYYMSEDSNPLHLADATRDTMYTAHKTIGFVILWLVAARLVYRLTQGAPPSEPSLTPMEKGGSHAVHWLLYLLLLAVPIGGWLGVSKYGATGLFWGLRLPSIAAVDQKASETVFAWHGIGAKALFVLFLVHLAGALYHRLVKKDGVLSRMLPGAGD